MKATDSLVFILREERMGRSRSSAVGLFAIFVFLSAFSGFLWPAIITVAPAANALNVSKSSTISVTFDQDMNPSTINENTFIVHTQQAGMRAGTYSYDSGSRTATFEPTAGFPVGDVVTVTLTVGIESAAGAPLADSFAWSFTVAVGSGNGTFSVPAPTYAVGTSPNGSFAADYDGDGDIDVATANVDSNDVSVLLNQGDGTFTTPAPIYGTGSSPLGIFGGDFDGDDDIDLATTNGNDNTVSVLLNNGNGTFATPAPAYGVGNGSNPLTGGDFDGDGDIDLATGNGLANTVSVLLNNGDGTFATPAPAYAVGSSPRGIYCGDFDNDGDIDLVTANYGTHNVSILLNNGNGTFATPAPTYGAGGNCRAVFTADFDNDGDIDLATGNEWADGISVLLNNGNSTFAAQTQYSQGVQIRSVFGGDFDHDGDIDLAAGGSDVHIFLNNGNGTFASAVLYDTNGVSSNGFSGGDFDGMGSFDLAFSGGTVSILLSPTYTVSGTVTCGGSPMEGVVMNGLPGDPTTDASGQYSVKVDPYWSGTVTPILTGYAFSPGNRVYSDVTTDQTAQDYAATLLPAYTISGTITSGGSALAGVVMGGLPGNPLTDASGFYTATVFYGWSGTVTPTLAGYVFTPVTRTYSAVSFDQTAQDYTAAVFTSIPQVEREALIALYNSTNGDSWTNNSGWKTPPLYADGFAMPGTENTWYGISTDSGNTMVISIDLTENHLLGTIPASLGNLVNLQTLTLDNNLLSGTIPTILGSLNNLQHLSCYTNQFSGNIPTQLGSLGNLKYLDLGDNQLTGTIPSEMGNLINLEYFDLWINQLTGYIPPELGNLSKVTHFVLGSNQLTGSIPPELGSLINLYHFDLSQNQLTGNIPIELGNLSNPHDINLAFNQLTGYIPTELCNLTSLQGLYLNSNQLSGSIPPELGNLSNLENLSLNSNQLSGSIPSELGNLSKLQQLNLGSNQLTGSIPPELGNLTELIELLLNINQLTGSIPVEIGNLSNLIYLCLNKNQLTGNIPPELGNLSNLQILLLNLNQLSGTIPLQIGNLNHLEMLLLNSNQLTGTIPTSLGNLSNLQLLWFNSNQLSGSIPIELGNLSNLTELWLSSNQLTDTIPSELGNLSNLQYLALDSNQHTGTIPAELGNLSNLQLIWLNSNQLSGTIPTSLQGLSMLHMSLLDIGYNALYTSDADLISFLNGKDVDWAQTQTIAPSNISATPVSSTTINLTWDAIPYSGDTGGYRVSVGTALGGPYTFFQQTADKGVTSLPVTGLNPETPYYFIIQARTDVHTHNQNIVNSGNSTETSASTYLQLTVSGTILTGGLPLANIIMNGLPGNPVTNGSGFYTASVDYNWSGTVTPTLTGYTFTPQDRNYTNVTADLTGQDFTATLNAYTISGTVTFDGSPLANVTMSGLPGNPVTNSSGSYSSGVYHGWSGIATPTLQYFTFTPGSTTYSSIGSSQTTDYTASLTQSLVVTAPNSAALWEKGKTYAITWLKQGAQNSNVKIYLYKGTATLVKTIVTTTPNDGSFDWLVPTTLATGSTYFIKVKTVDNLISDDSDKFSIIVPTITVMAPTTGTVWVKNATKTITWTKLGTQDSNVKIQLYKGTVKKLDITLLAPNNGTYDWAIPSTLANALYTIRITALDGKVQGKSATFSVTTGLIQITQPVTGNKLIRGTSREITWVSDGAVNTNVKIQLYKGTAKVLDISLSTPTASGTFTWDIPNTQALAANYSIKVTALDNLVTGKTGNFAIVPGIITVTQPATGTVWQRGLAHTITWDREGSLLNAYVKIQLYKGALLKATLAASTENDGSFDWTIPAAQALASNYKIRITTIDNLVRGDSGAFTIASSVGLTLLTPNGGEILKPTQTQAIRWTDNPDVLEVKLEFSRDNGGSFATIADHVPDTGSYDWIVPVNFTRNGIVRVSDSNGKLWRDVGLLEFSFKFNYGGEGEEPGAVFWFGGSDPQAPGYGFARIEIGRDRVQFGGSVKTIEPLVGAWHELRVRFDFRRDTAEIRLDDKTLFANAALNTTQEHYFQPYLVLQTGGGAPLDFMMDDLAINIVLLDSTGEDKQLFNILSENFDRYDARANGLQNCWQWQNTNDTETKVELNLENMGNKSLRLQTASGKQLMIYLPFALPDKVPFDISDQCFAIENQSEKLD